MTVRTAAAAIFVALAASPAMAAELARANAFRGTIGDRLAIEMELDRDDRQLHGSYVYMKKGEPLLLAGRVEPDGRVLLEETAGIDAMQTGSFAGSLAADGTLTGEWTSADGTKSLPFRLAPATAAATDGRLAPWVGRWERENSDITLVALPGGRLRGWGYAVGPYVDASGEATADIGEFHAIAMPRDDSVTFDQGGCTLTAKLTPDGLVVSDETGCSGMRATFVGVYYRMTQ